MLWASAVLSEETESATRNSARMGPQLIPLVEHFRPARSLPAMVCAGLRLRVVIAALLSLMMIVRTAGPAAADPIRVAKKTVGPPIWCDDATLVYAGEAGPRTSWPTAIYRHVAPGGPSDLIAKVDGIAVPFYCRQAKVLYWTLPSADCEPLSRGVMIKQVGREAAALACGANLALPSPDGRLLAISAGPLPKEPWELVGAGARILGGDATALVAVDLDGREFRDILSGADVSTQLPTRDLVAARFGVHRMLASYARGRGAYQWVADDAIAVAVYHATGPGSSLVVARIDPRSGRIVKVQVALSTDREIGFVQPLPRSRFLVASRGEFPRSLQRCEVLAEDVDCRPYDLAGVLARAGLTNWESSIDRAGFNGQGGGFHVIADSAEGRCLAAVDL